MQRALSVGLVASLLLTACGGAPTPAAPPAASATPAPVKVSASYSNVVASKLPLWVAKEAGSFARQGLDVELTLVESSKGIPALLAGDVKFAHIGGSEVVSAAAGGADLVIVGGTVPVWPYVLIVAPDIKKLEDLKGKKLAIAGIGGSYDIAARVLLPRLRLKPDDDVAIIATGSVAEATAAPAGGAGQAALSEPPHQLAPEPKGFPVVAKLADLHLSPPKTPT